MVKHELTERQKATSVFRKKILSAINALGEGNATINRIIDKVLGKDANSWNERRKMLGRVYHHLERMEEDDILSKEVVMDGRRKCNVYSVIKR